MTLYQQATINEYMNTYKALRDHANKRNINISIPEFVFISFDCYAHVPFITHLIPNRMMQQLQLTRFPMRFELISNPRQKTPLIKINGIEYKNEQEIKCKIHEMELQSFENDIICKDIVDIKIESSHLAEHTFVDLPSLLKGIDKYTSLKKQLDELIAHFLYQQFPDGSYKYIPILIRRAIAVEYDTHFEVSYIDNLIQRYGDENNKRLNWKDDTLFVVHKFTEQMHRASWSSLIEYIKYCREYGETVITTLDLSKSMDNDENETFVDELLKDFTKYDEELVDELKTLISELCGIKRMNEILTEKQYNFAKNSKILPFLYMSRIEQIFHTMFVNHDIVRLIALYFG